MSIVDRAPWLTINDANEDLLAELERLLARPPWQADAACLEHPAGWWFPERGGGSANVAKAKAVCASCLVGDECRAWALEQDQALLYGLWGGLTQRDRRALQAGERTLDELVAALPSAPATVAIPKAPPIRSGTGACRVCGRVCRPDQEHPHDRLKAGLCPADHGAFLRWRKTHHGDQAEFIKVRTAA